MSFSLLHWLEFFILPPGIIFVMLLIALIISRFKPLFGFLFGVSSIILLLVLSMPLTARYLLSSLQDYPVFQASVLKSDPTKTALVILGAGRYEAAPEYGYRDEITPLTLERLRYGANIAKLVETPIVLSGGRRNADATSEAVIMNQIMVNIFELHPQYLEIKGINTGQQAIKVKELLAVNDINTIILVTHAWHMKRAVSEFESQQFEVIPAPMGFAATSKQSYQFMPSAAALASSSRAMHEHYGLLYQQLFR